MKVIRKQQAKSQKGKAFTGETVLDEMLQPQVPAGIKLTLVRFSEGARTHWHAHPGEQVLYILEGEGRVGTETEEVLVHAGDVVHAMPGERHWHGAVEGKSMTHLSITTVGSPQWFEAPQ